MTTSLTTGPIPEYDPYNKHREPRPVSRVSGKGLENYSKGRGTLHIGEWAMESKDWSSPRPQPKVKYEEAVNNLKKNEGTTMKELLTGYLDMPMQHKGPRVKPEAKSNFQQSRGVVGSVCFKEYGKSETDKNSKPKVYYDGTQNYEKGQGASMAHLIHEYGHLAQSARPVPRIKNEARSNAEHANGSALSKTIQQQPPTDRIAKTATPRMSVLW